MDITWLDYLYANKKDELFDVIRSYGMPAPQSYEELYECVDILIQKEGESAEKAILKIHPDYEGIKKLVVEEAEVKDDFHNFSGEISSIKTELTSQIENNKLTSEVNVLKRNQNVLMVVCGFLLYHTILNSKK